MPLPIDISVVIPLYNKEAHILVALRSIYENSCSVREVIVVDDCSTDNSLELVINFVRTYKGPIQFQLVRMQSNQGPINARLRGIREARGDYVAFLDADDLWHIEFVKSVSSALRVSQPDMLAVAFYSKRLSKQIFYAKDFEKYCMQAQDGTFRICQLEKVLCKNFILGGGNVIAKRRLFDGLEITTNDRNFEDWLLWLQIIGGAEHPLSVQFLDRALYVYNDDVSDSLSNKVSSSIWSAQKPAVIAVASNMGFYKLSRVIFWNWITGSAKRIPSFFQRMRFFARTGFGLQNFCCSRYFLSGVGVVLFGGVLIKLAEKFRKQD